VIIEVMPLKRVKHCSLLTVKRHKKKTKFEVRNIRSLDLVIRNGIFETEY